MAVTYTYDQQTMSNNNTKGFEEEKYINVQKLIIYCKSLINVMKSWNLCVIIQIIMVGMILISEQQAAKINLVFGFFIPIYQHFVAIKQQRYFDSSNNSFSSPILNSYNLTKKFGPSCLRSSQNSLNSQSSLSSNSSTNSSVTLNNEKKKQHQSETFAHANSDKSPEDGNAENSMNSSLKDFYQKGLDDDQNLQLTHSKYSNSSNLRNSLTSTTTNTNSISVHINQILSYWPMFCVLLIIEQQLMPKSIVKCHEFQILKCLVILIIRNYSFSIYLFFKDVIQMKSFDQSLFSTPENTQLKNQFIMQKIDDQIKCYSKLKISLCKYEQSLKSPIVQQSFISQRRVIN